MNTVNKRKTFMLLLWLKIKSINGAVGLDHNHKHFDEQLQNTTTFIKMREQYDFTKH